MASETEQAEKDLREIFQILDPAAYSHRVADEILSTLHSMQPEEENNKNGNTK